MEKHESKKLLPRVSQINNQVILMRKTVKQAKVLTIRLLTRTRAKLIQKKGNAKQLEKNKSKCERILVDIQAMKRLKKDDVSVYALLNECKLEDVLRRTDVEPHDRAVARLADHRLIKTQVKEFKNNRPYWKLQIQEYGEKYRKHKATKLNRQNMAASIKHDTERVVGEGNNSEVIARVISIAEDDSAAKQSSRHGEESVEENSVKSEEETDSHSESETETQKQDSGDRDAGTSSDEEGEDAQSNSSDSEDSEPEAKTPSLAPPTVCSKVLDRAPGKHKLKQRPPSSSSPETSEEEKEISLSKASHSDMSVQCESLQQKRKATTAIPSEAKKTSKDMAIKKPHVPFSSEMELKPFDLLELDPEGELPLGMPTEGGHQASIPPSDDDIPTLLLAGRKESAGSNNKKKRRDAFFEGADSSENESDVDDGEEGSAYDLVMTQQDEIATNKGRQFMTSAQRYRKHGDREGAKAEAHKQRRPFDRSRNKEQWINSSKN
ncbi:PREDICTED: serum response factor-binding protein 1-like [Priapulus caudatus]|uniref:Serum response factor-binding protein 1-like n=1 Tax=Priapulus caudatus TaxID=37621 RepID=A0ABM1EVK7_PRICU|nr:PREDICTED: serum response factor-binding protein 1-like [Priapulus caudatus]